MAGLGVKLFRNGEVLSDDELNGYLMDQVVAVFDSASTRTLFFGDGETKPELTEGRISYLRDSNLIQFYDGTQWVDSSSFTVGDSSITTQKLDVGIIVNGIFLRSATLPSEPASSTPTSTVTIADGKTVTISNTLTMAGTDSSSIAFGAGGTVAYNYDLRDAHLRAIMEVV